MRYSPDRLDLTLALLTALAFATMALAGAGRGLTLVNGAVLTIAAIKGRPIVLDSRFAICAGALARAGDRLAVVVVGGLAWAVPASFP